MNLSEKRLIFELKKHNYQNFDIFYKNYVDYIHYVVSIYIKNKETIDDITQEVFMRILEKIDLFNNDKSSFKTWIYNLTKNYCINYLTRNQEKYILDEISVNLKRESNNLDYELSKMDLKTYLTELEYNILFLKIEGKLKHDEIAEVLNITIDKSKKTYRIAISKAKEILK